MSGKKISAGPNESSAGVEERREENDPDKWTIPNKKDCLRLIMYPQIPHSKRTNPDPKDEARSDNVWKPDNHDGELHASRTGPTPNRLFLPQEEKE